MKIKNLKIDVPSLTIPVLAVAYVLGLAATETRASRFEGQSMTHAREATTICRTDLKSRIEHRELAQEYKERADYWHRISQYLNPLSLFIPKPRQYSPVPTSDNVLTVHEQTETTWWNLEELSKELLGGNPNEFKQDSV